MMQQPAENSLGGVGWFPAKSQILTGVKKIEALSSLVAGLAAEKGGKGMDRVVGVYIKRACSDFRDIIRDSYSRLSIIVSLRGNALAFIP